MPDQDTTPLISRTAFSCPHCSAFTTQYWYKLYVRKLDEDQRTPFIPPPDFGERLRANSEITEEMRNHFAEWANKKSTRRPFLEPSEENLYKNPVLENCNISICYNCKEVAIWVGEQFVYPKSKVHIRPNEDLPEHIRALFNEAREIVDSSPKGSAALLRLCIQHLCKQLGESGKNIDNDISNLVSKGLNPLVQQALDIVRVVGNESVHPGSIDLNDNKEVAVKLFDLVNLVADQMISHPKSVQRLYEALPAAKLKRIEERNEKVKGGD